jgi:hypothetical protein
MHILYNNRAIEKLPIIKELARQVLIKEVLLIEISFIFFIKLSASFPGRKLLLSPNHCFRFFCARNIKAIH